MSLPEYTDQILSLLAGATLTGVAAAWRNRGRISRLDDMVAKFADFYDDWNGVADRPGVPGRKGVMVRLADLETGQAQRAAVQDEQAAAMLALSASVEQIRQRLDSGQPPDVPRQRNVG